MTENNKLVNEELSKIFGPQYASTIHLMDSKYIATILEDTTKNDDKIMLQTEESGGNATMKWVCERLGLKIIDMPYDYQNRNIDYDKVYEILKKEDIKIMLYAPKDIINTPDYSKLALPDNTIFLYDASQTLDLIAGKQVDNPLEKLKEKNCIVFGDLVISFYEMEKREGPRAKKINERANAIGKQLKDKGICVIVGEKAITSTHQLFIQTSETDMKAIFNLSNKYNITLRRREKKLFDNFGIRLEIGEISELFSWKNEEEQIKKVVDILFALFTINESELKKLMD